VILVYIDTKNPVELVEQTFTNLKKITTEYSDGSAITYLIPEQPESEKIAPSEKIIEKAQDENATTVEKAIEKYIAPQENIVQYSKEDPKGVVVSGYILLTDEITGKFVKPYTFRVFITLECDSELNLVDGFNFCTSDPVFGRVETTNGGKDKDGNDLGGFFEYVWHASFKTSSGFYDVSILVTKDQPQIDGTYKDFKKTYKIQVL